MVCFVAWHAEIYSASHVDSTITDCFLLIHEIAVPLSGMTSTRPWLTIMEFPLKVTQYQWRKMCNSNRRVLTSGMSSCEERRVWISVLWVTKDQLKTGFIYSGGQIL